MLRGSDLPVRTKRLLLNKAGGWQGTRKKDAKKQDGQSWNTHTHAQNSREDSPPAFNPHPENKKKMERNHGVEEYGMKSSFHVGVKVGRRMGNEAQQRLAPGFG